ncbi:MAG: hypothetical protein AAGE59_07830 [Cyanobacteria bacterium P01_F01_bin.86]
MASVSQVQAYLAYWFQLGKPIIFHKSQTQCLPSPIFQGNQFSEAFQECWQQVAQDTSDCHLQGTDQTIADLLAGEWDITECARCEMPVPMPVRLVDSSACPCNDMPTWPNDEIPQPRMGVDNGHHLQGIRDRLLGASGERDRLQSVYEDSPNLPQPVDEQPQTPHQEATRATGS